MKSAENAWVKSMDLNRYIFLQIELNPFEKSHCNFKIDSPSPFPDSEIILKE